MDVNINLRKLTVMSLLEAEKKQKRISLKHSYIICNMFGVLFVYFPFRHLYAEVDEEIHVSARSKRILFSHG